MKAPWEPPLEALYELLAELACVEQWVRDLIGVQELSEPERQRAERFANADDPYEALVHISRFKRAALDSSEGVRTFGDACKLPGCERRAAAQGMCTPHYHARIVGPKRKAKKTKIEGDS